MSYVCPECGSEVPDDADFCYRCGRMRSDGPRQEGATGLVCPECGAPLKGGESFCGGCGAPVSPMSFPLFPPIRLKMKKHAMIAIALAIVPGLFHVYGLGHLVLKKWSKGAMFICITALLWWARFSMGNSMIYILLDLGVYMYQLMDIMGSIYERGSRCRTGPRSTARRPWTGSSGTRRPSTPSAPGPGPGTRGSRRRGRRCS